MLFTSDHFDSFLFKIDENILHMEELRLIPR